METLNRELEQRVAERTEQLQQRAGALEQLNCELARKNQELDAIVKTAPDIIFSRQADGARDYISARFYEYTGAPAGSASGFGWLDYVHPDDREHSLSRWIHCVQSSENYESEYRIRGKDGHYRWFRARAIPIRDQSGKPGRWYGTCSDIHDSKLVENSMRENANQLEKMVSERTSALRHLSSRLMTMQDDERRRISRELHDGLGQELVAIKLILEGISRQDSALLESQISEASGMIDHATQQIRSLSHLLHPPLLDEVGLLSALRWYVDGLSKRSGIETVLEVRPDFPRLTLALETAIFRIIQEALTNVFRHSGARKSWVTLTQRRGQIVVKVRDNGKGIGEEVVELLPGSVGVGIEGMGERAKEFGGRLRLTNARPGTIVEVTIPCGTASRAPVFREPSMTPVVRGAAPLSADALTPPEP